MRNGIRGAYISNWDLRDECTRRIGVCKKIIKQVECMDEFFKVEYMQVVDKRNPWFAKLARRLPLLRHSVKWDILKDVLDLDFLYIRKQGFDFSFFQFLKRLKKKNNSIRVLVELPTYPYDKEISCSKLPGFNLVKDKFYRNRLKKHVDRIVTFSQDEYIFEIPTIQIKNGIDVLEVNPVDAKKHSKSTPIHLIMVAAFADWHGLDRIIEGLIAYYSNPDYKREVFLHVVGDSGADVLKKAQERAAQSEVGARYVIFYGPKYGAELDEIFNQCDIGVECLGGHRKGLWLSSSLKSREYCAKGMPMVSSCKIDIFEDGSPYLLRVPSDDSAIDIQQIIRFHDDIYVDGERASGEVITFLRTHALEHCDMKKTMAPVIGYLQR